MKSFITIFVFTFLFAFIGAVVVQACEYQPPTCDVGQVLDGDSCVPIVVDPCLGEKVDQDCVTPSPEEPTVTPEPPCTQDCGNPPTFADSSTNAPAADTCNIPFDKPLLQGFHADGNGSVTFSWWGVSGVDKYSIRYGYAPDQLVYGADNIDKNATSFQINGLEQGKNVWAVVTAYKGDCGEDSNLLDPIVK